MITQTHNRIVQEWVYKKSSNLNEHYMSIYVCYFHKIFARPFSYKGSIKTVNTHNMGGSGNFLIVISMCGNMYVVKDYLAHYYEFTISK